MERNPYAPPNANLENPWAGAPRDAGFASAPVAPLSPEVEMRAMAELGQRRAKARNRAFVIGWPACTIVLVLVGVGVILAAILGSAIAGAITKVYMRSRNRALADEVCRDLGINPAAFSPERYLID